MNLDLKNAYALSNRFIKEKKLFSSNAQRIKCCCNENTGSIYNTLQGSFDSSSGDFRKLNVSAGTGGRSYLSFTKIEDRLTKWCQEINARRSSLFSNPEIYEKIFILL